MSVTRVARLVVVAAVAVAAFALPSSALAVANVHTVGAGEDFPTLQLAIDDVDTIAGETLVVSDGTYPGDVNITKAVTITGPNAGLEAGAARGAEADIQGGVLISVSGVTIDGLLFTTATDHPLANTGAKIQDNYTDLNAEDDVVIRSNLFSNIDSHAVSYLADDVDGDNWTIEDNEVTGWTGNNGTAFIFVGASNITIDDNIIGQNLGGTSARGIQVDSAAPATVSNNVITGLSNYALQVTRSQGGPAGTVDVHDNTITGNVLGVRIRAIDGVQIDQVNIFDNTFTDQLNASIWVDGFVGALDTATFNDINISTNTFTQDVADFAAGTKGIIDVALPPLGGPHGPVSISDNEFTLAGAPAAAVSPQGIVLHGALDVANVTDNSFDGGNVGHGGSTNIASSGVLVDTNNATFGTNANMTLEVSGNSFTDFESAVSTYDVVGAAYGNLAVSSSIDILYNRIVGNTNGLTVGTTGTVLTAIDNWWGCNEGPTDGDCDSVIGTVANADPYLVLNVVPDTPTIASNGATMDVTATMSVDSGNNIVSPDYPDANSTDIDFATDIGSIDGTAATSGGIAVANFQTDAATGTATVTATLDNATAQADVEITAAHARYSVQNGDIVEVFEAVGEDNEVTVTYTPGLATFTEADAAAMSTGPGCTATAATTVECAVGIAQGCDYYTTVNLGDGNDIWDADDASATGCDTVDGGDGDDVILLGPGNDTASPRDGTNTIEGGDGDDSFNNEGATSIGDDWTGGDGYDTIDMNGGSDPVEVTLDNIADDGTAGETDNVRDDVEQVSANTTGGAVLTGTAGADVLVGGAGPDTIDGLDGNDTLSGQDGSDELIGGPGDDTLVAQGSDSESDYLYGDAGDDFLQGDMGADELYGDAGFDELQPFGNGTIADAGTEDDLITVMFDPFVSGNMYLSGGDGTDEVAYEVLCPCDDITINLDGNPNDGDSTNPSDWIEADVENASGSIGSDTLIGNEGTNQLMAGAGNDVSVGGAGADTIEDSFGNDTILGGSGDDDLRGGDGVDTVYGQGGADEIDGEGDPDMLFGGDGADTVLGSFGDDILDGGANNDTLFGEDGEDDIEGGDGNDTLDGSFGADIIRGGAGSDTVRYDDAASNVTVDLDNVADDGEAGETDNVRSTVENITGSDFVDVLTGSAAPNTILGGLGNDIIKGLGGNDTLKGEAGVDNVDGGIGADTLFGGTENDTLIGGTGADKFFGEAGNDLLKALNKDKDTVNGGSGTDTGVVDRIKGTTRLLDKLVSIEKKKYK